LYARAFVTRYPGLLRLRGSLCFSPALYGIIWTGFIHDHAVLPQP
jgi:hypothetical protein